MEQYLLKCEKGYYWIWFRGSKEEKPQINGPHSEPMINLPEIKIDNPLKFNPEIHASK